MKTNIPTFFLCALLACGCASTPTNKPMTNNENKIVPKVTLTFDDGFAEHYTLVAPLLEKYGFRGVFNIVVKSIDTGWDFETGHKFMTWDQIRDLQKRGHEIANHTYTHVNLRELAEKGDFEALRHELVDSKAKIEQETGVSPRWLCHPFVAFNDTVNEEIRKAGMRPMRGGRRNFGEGTVAFTESGVGAYLKACADHGDTFVDVLTHGVTPEGHGWRPYAKVEDFEEHLKELRSLVDAGKIVVLDHYGLDD